jgi:putative membrane protein
MKHLIVFLKGMAMGAADVVPGVSGGTIAFITGIYDRLIESISRVDLTLWGKLRKEGIKSAWEYLNGSFLLALVAGILTSIFSLAKLFSWLLATHPVPLWSFFFGLVAGSVFLIGGSVKNRNLIILLFFIFGTGISYYITTASPAEVESNLPYIFLCGAIAICAMILPGISGSFILLLMGAYATVLGAVSELNIPIILVFMAGAIIGLLSFSRILKYLLSNHHQTAIALLTGFLVGSLNKIWPWKTNIETRINSKGDTVAFLTENVWPGKYHIVSDADAALGIVNKDPQTGLAILFAIVGLVLVVLLGSFSPKDDSQ